MVAQLSATPDNQASDDEVVEDIAAALAAHIDADVHELAQPPIIGSGATQAVAGNDSRLTNTRTPTDGTVTDVKITSAGLSISRIKDLARMLVSTEQKRAPYGYSADGRRLSRSVTKHDIRMSYKPNAYMDVLHRSFDGKTIFDASGKRPFVWIDIDFPRYSEIVSVAYYDNDSNLAAGDGTPLTTPLATTTEAPFSLGGVSVNGELLPWSMAGLADYTETHTMSIVVEYGDGTSEITTAEYFPCNTYNLGTMSNIQLALASGETDQIGPGVIDFRAASTNATRAAMARLEANGHVLVDCVGSNQGSLSGSNCTFYGEFEWLGGLLIRGQDYTLEGNATKKQWMSYPYWLATGIEGASRVLQIDGIGYSAGSGTGNLAERVNIKHAVLDFTVSDLFNTSRGRDIYLEDVTFGDGWDLVSNSHTDGMQTSGSLFASGNLKDSEGDAVALLMRNCTWYGTNLIDKPDLGPSGPHTYENCHWFNSGRVGVQLQPNSPVNNVEWVKFRNCSSNAHATYDYLNTPNSGNYIPIKTRKGIITGTATTTWNEPSELQYGTPVSSDVVVVPPVFSNRPTSIRVGDLSKPTAINGTSVSVSRPGVSGYGSTYVVAVLLNDETVNIARDASGNVLNVSDVANGLTYVGAQGLTGGGKLWILQFVNYAGVNAGPWVIKFVDAGGVSTTAVGVAYCTASSFAGEGVESIAFATPTAVTAGQTITAPDVVAGGRNRQVKWFFGVAKTASAGTWTKPALVNGGSPLSATVATQINTFESSNINANAAILEAYRPQSHLTHIGNQGTLDASYSVDGYAFACALVIGPSKEPPPATVVVPGLTLDSIASRVDWWDTDNLAEQLDEIYRLAATAAGEVIPPAIFDSKGELLAATGNDTYDAVAPGADGQVPIYDSSSTTGISAGTAASGVAVLTEGQTLGNSTTETVVLGPLTIPSDYVIAGRTYRIELWGRVDNDAAASVNIRIRIGAVGNVIGGTSFATLGITGVSGKTAQPFVYRGTITFRDESGSSVEVTSSATCTNATANTTTPSAPEVSSINTTSDRALGVTAQWAGASVTNVLYVEGGTIELVK